jgi:type III pantothenate kinase
MNAAIDAGNTLIKVGIFNHDGHLEEMLSFSSSPVENIYTHLSSRHFDHCIISSVIKLPDHIFKYLQLKSKQLLTLDKDTKLPLTVKYKTPETLGKDRLALAVGASARYPGKDVLNISIGTCITYNFVNAKAVFLGGAISPGLHMRLRAMHEFTAGLPLINLDESNHSLIGSNTADAMASGIVNGAVFEIEGYVNELRKKHKNCAVILSGGDSRYVAEKLNIETEIEPDLALIGLNIILKLNVPEKN